MFYTDIATAATTTTTATTVFFFKNCPREKNKRRALDNFSTENGPDNFSTDFQP